jgi:hypothetical protein
MRERVRMKRSTAKGLPCPCGRSNCSYSTGGLDADASEVLQSRRSFTRGHYRQAAEKEVGATKNWAAVSNWTWRTERTPRANVPISGMDCGGPVGSAP